MDLTVILVAALAMFAAAAAFLVVILRSSPGGRPRDAFGWTGIGLSVLLLVVAGFLSVQTVVRMTAPPPVPEAPLADDAVLDEPAPDFTFRQVSDAEERVLEGLEGNVVVLNFWATWCAPCLVELPDLNRLQETYRDQGLVVVTVSDEPPVELEAFMERVPLETLSGYVANPAKLPMPYRQMLEVRPMTFIIDREGRLRYRILGARDYETFERLIQPYLDASPIAAGADAADDLAARIP